MLCLPPVVDSTEHDTDCTRRRLTAWSCYDVMTRTTIDLPDDIHTLAREIAHQQRKTLSQVITEFVLMGLEPVVEQLDPLPEPRLPSVRLGRRVTIEDVRTLEDM